MPPSRSAAWTPADFYHNAKEIRRRLQVWGVDDGVSPSHWATRYESKEWERRTFNSILFQGRHGPRPSPGCQVYPGLLPPDGLDKGYAGSAFPDNDRLTDRSLTQWSLREYAERLKRVKKQSEPWRLLRLAFDRAMQEPMYHVRIPDERDGPVDCHYARCQQEENPTDPRVFKVIGRPIDGEILDSFVEAAKQVFEPPTRHGAAANAGKKIPPTKRTRPMSLKDAACRMGYTLDRRGNAVPTKKAAESLRQAMDIGAVAFEALSRKRFVFSRDDFPKESWPKILPKP